MMKHDMRAKGDRRWRGQLVVPLLVLLGILVLSIVAWAVITGRHTPVPPVPEPPPVKTQRSQELAAFYDVTIRPVLDENRKANLEAVNRCIARIDDCFNRYRGGIKPFADDLTSMKTRFGVLRRMPAAWWYKDDRILRYIQEKYEKHIFAEGQLHHDLTAALMAFRDELYANRNEMLASVKVAVSGSDYPELAIPDYQEFDRQVWKLLTEFASNRALDSVYHGIATLIASEVVATVVTQIITRAVTNLGGLLIPIPAGVAAGGAAAGAAGGSLAGPVGTAIGLGVGLVVGALVDWWMTGSFRAELETDLNQYLTMLRDQIIEGTNQETGLRRALEEFVNDYAKAQETVFRRHLLQGAL